MDAMNAALALLAGIFSTLSPCVLPILPLVLGAAATEHRLAPVALAGGLAVSFTAIGLFVATIGFAVGLDTALFRGVAAAAPVAASPAGHRRFEEVLTESIALLLHESARPMPEQ